MESATCQILQKLSDGKLVYTTATLVLKMVTLPNCVDVISVVIQEKKELVNMKQYLLPLSLDTRLTLKHTHRHTQEKEIITNESREIP